MAPRGAMLIEDRHSCLLITPVLLLLVSEFILRNFFDTSIKFPVGPTQSLPLFPDFARRYHFMLVVFFQLGDGGYFFAELISSGCMPVNFNLTVRIGRTHDAVTAAGSPKIGKKVTGFDINRVATRDATKQIIAIVSPILASGLMAARFGGIG